MVKKVSDITVQDIAEYLRIAELDSATEIQLTTFLESAKSYCSSYTGIPISSYEEGAETLDDYLDIIIAVYVLCEDFYDNRAMYVDGKSANRTVRTILDMHTRNNLC